MKGNAITPLEAKDFSGPEPGATPESSVPHQWYITTNNPPSTISVGDCFGPGETGLYLATDKSTFFSTKEQMHTQVGGWFNADYLDHVTVHVTGATVVSTPSMVDINSQQTVTIVAGKGDPAKWFTAFPGKEGGDDEDANGTPEDKPAEAQSASSDHSEGTFEVKGMVDAKAVALAEVQAFVEFLPDAIPCAVNLAGLHLKSCLSNIPAVAATAVAMAMFGESANRSKAQAEPIGKAGKAWSVLSDEYDTSGRREGKHPDVVFAADGQISGFAKEGIGLATPEGIRLHAEKGILNFAPVIVNSSEGTISNQAAQYINNTSEWEIRNEAKSILGAGIIIGNTAAVLCDNFGGVVSSIVSPIAATVTAGIMAGISGQVVAEMKSYAMLNLESLAITAHSHAATSISAGGAMTVTAGAAMALDAGAAISIVGAGDVSVTAGPYMHLKAGTNINILAPQVYVGSDLFCSKSNLVRLA